MKQKKVILSRDTIQQRVRKLGAEISRDYKKKQLLMLGILNGAFIFQADLVRSIELAMEIDFIQLSSYGNSVDSSGQIELIKPPQLSLTDKDILLVEDIVDTGATLHWLKKYLTRHYKPRSVKSCILLDKAERRQIKVTPDYTAFSIEGGFLVGYGLDYAQKYRNLPDIWAMQP